MDDTLRSTEPPDYIEWRKLLYTDHHAAITTANAPGKDYPCLLFMVDTEMRLSWPDFVPRANVLFAWDEGDGVWVLEPTENDCENLKEFLKRDFMHWHEALEKCGAVHFSHWQDNFWSRTANEKTHGTVDWKPFYWAKKVPTDEPVAQYGISRKEADSNGFQQKL
ncbi:hypothetical protein PABG_12446 [Paracoccidioides brasiliensis Pb03]|nr:hypothetical protein PABG_12446 [Paracoccidioides brasiliensis Pb03]